MPPLRVALVGAGNIGSHHLPAYAQFPEQVELVAICDLDQSLAQKRAHDAGVAEHVRVAIVWAAELGKHVGADGDRTTRPEFGTGVFHQQPYLDVLRRRRPDLPLVPEHPPLEHVPAAIERCRASFS